MKYNPHSYQKYAAEFIEVNPISCLLLDMGLGKTVITLTALNDLLFDSFEAHKVLVIAPLRVARDTWPDELIKWEHLNGLRYSVARSVVWSLGQGSNGFLRQVPERLHLIDFTVDAQVNPICLRKVLLRGKGLIIHWLPPKFDFRSDWQLLTPWIDSDLQIRFDCVD